MKKRVMRGLSIFVLMIAAVGSFAIGSNIYHPVYHMEEEKSIINNGPITDEELKRNPLIQADENGNAQKDVQTNEDSGHTIYLTFDDGPGPYTERLLDILKKNNVQATFFVTNVFSDYEHLLKREAEEGHAVGVHSYSHDYNKIYASTDAYWEDFTAMQKVILKQTGEDTKLMRFPGGSSNIVSENSPFIMTKLVHEAEEKGLSYFDWNVNSGDVGNGTSSAEVLENCKKGVESHTNAVILCHDVKEYTVNAMEEFITWAKENGYTFAALTPDSYGAHHEVLN